MALEVGLKENESRQCLQSPCSQATVEQDIAEAQRLGVSGTPSFFVNGKKVTGAVNFETFKREVERDENNWDVNAKSVASVSQTKSNHSVTTKAIQQNATS